MALVTRPLIGELGWRKVGILSSVLTSIAFVISAFSPCPEFLFFSISLLSGIGAGIAVSLCFIILPLYFDRKRGVANSIMMAGICMGQIVGPPVARFLQDEYGFKGATLIIGALILNSCVGACFFHPVEWHLKKTRREAVSLPQEDEALLCEQNAKRNSAASNSQISCNESKGDQDLMPFAMLKKQRGGLHSAEASSISRNSSSLCISTIDIAGVGTIPVSELIEEPYPYVQDSNRSSSFCISKTFLRIVRGTAKDLTILRSPRVCILALNGTCFLNGYFNFMMIVPFAMQAAGRSLEDSAWCISISSICNLLLRVVVSSLSDFPRFNKRACYVSGFVVTSLTMFTFPLLVELRWQILTMAGFGCGIGATMGLYTITMIDVMGLDSLAPVFGATSFAVAFGFLCFGPMIGFIRDLTRSYAISMWAMGGTVLCSALSWFLMPAATRYDQRRADKQHQQPEKTNSKI
ncbi:hypothetical protein OTU49_005114 [Cherax quadricarinatus]|uniref:Monocarboxylate transporter n=2 Tax=Cherax quadricarinatus TaxID=27406 RepID=A0AAW0YMJ4_CHEQU